MKPVNAIGHVTLRWTLAHLDVVAFTISNENDILTRPRFQLNGRLQVPFRVTSLNICKMVVAVIAIVE